MSQYGSSYNVVRWAEMSQYGSSYNVVRWAEMSQYGSSYNVVRWASTVVVITWRHRDEPVR